MASNTQTGRWALVALLLLFSYAEQASAQMKAPAEWMNYEKVLGLQNNLRHYYYDVTIAQSSTNTNVLWPEEQPAYTVQVLNNMDDSMIASGSVELIHYGTKARPNDIWLPEMVSLEQGSKAKIPVNIQVAARSWTNIDIRPLIPAAFGGYALVMDLGKYGRRLICSLVRTYAANPRRLQFPKQSLDDMGPDFLHRVGVQAIRMGVEYIAPGTAGYSKKMEELENKLKAYQEKNITVLLMFGAGDAPMPLGMPRPFLDSNQVMRKTKQDYVWLPSSDKDFHQFVYTLCTKYGWPRGPVTAVSLWNEPWEGMSISGWQSDIPRYREIYQVMADAVVDARKQGAAVLVGGGDSNSNAWDKLFADGKMGFLPLFDFCSIHYQGIESPAIYPEWVNRKSPYGRVKIWDTESWVGNTDDRIGLVVAVSRSAGYDRSMGIYAGYMHTGMRGSERARQKIRTPKGSQQMDRIPDSWSPAAAVGAVQHLVGERDFNRLLFTKGLPWIMLFNGYDDHADDGTAVVCGDIGEAFGADRVLFRGVKRTGVGQMKLPADKTFRLYDFYGNLVTPSGKYLIVPLNSQGYYLRTDGTKGSFAKLVYALESARIDGYEPAEIIAKDMTERVDNGAVLKLQLTNVLNRPVKGKLSVSLGNLILQAPAWVSLEAHEQKEVPVTVTGGKPATNNTYPLSVHFDAGSDGMATHNEDMHVNLISHLPIVVDGRLDDWQQALPQTVSSQGSGSVSLTEAAWYPFKNFDTKANGYATSYMAYDDHYFYFAAKVADSTPHPGTYRFENRPDDEFFYPDTAYAMDMQQALIGKQGAAEVNVNDLLVNDGKNKTISYWESNDNTNSFGIDLQLPEGKPMRVSFYLPAVKVNGLYMEVYNAATNQLLFQRKVDRLWNGVYETFDLAGKVRVVFHSYGWWYTAKLGGVFFDRTDAAGIAFVKEDFDTRGKWREHYGQSGYYIVGMQQQLPEGVAVQLAHVVVKQPLVWPAGVRHFTYRKNPVTPDNSGLGYAYDNVLLAFNAIPEGQDGMLANPPGTMPRYTGYKCTDYEYAFNQVALQYGGGTEIWRLLAPGLNRKHFFPRQPKSDKEGPVKGGKLVIRREGNTLITECAIPWEELPDVKKALDEKKTVKLSFRVNDDGAPGSCMELAKDRSVSKLNARAFHPDWKTHWANELEFSFEK
jgi:hypothetical protein